MIVTCGETAYSRKEAFETGKLYYFTGKPCGRGHLAPRYRAGDCVKCKLERSEEWHEANPEKAKAKDRRWREKNPDKIKAKLAHRRAPENIERTKALCRARYQKNKDKMHAAQVKWKSKPENREKAAAATRNWNARNPEKAKESNHRRRALKRGSVEHYTAKELGDLRARVGHRCAECLKRRKTTIDHIVPLSCSGSNSIRNIQFLCLPCNLTKNAKDPIDFARSRGRLL